MQPRRTALGLGIGRLAEITRDIRIEVLPASTKGGNPDLADFDRARIHVRHFFDDGVSHGHFVQLFQRFGPEFVKVRWHGHSGGNFQWLNAGTTTPPVLPPLRQGFLAHSAENKSRPGHNALNGDRLQPAFQVAGQLQATIASDPVNQLYPGDRFCVFCLDRLVAADRAGQSFNFEDNLFPDLIKGIVPVGTHFEIHRWQRSFFGRTRVSCRGYEEHNAHK
ncbi:MAG: hypothetical protein BWY83_03296 [bacterium ADurb.Bin478]|nr:MAG: hypothetical protein BWY83_03296 [bacterium ADurb.Bin478]